MQLGDQRTHLLAHRAVHTLDGMVSSRKVSPGRQVSITALLVSDAQHLVFLAQGFEATVQAGVILGVAYQARQDALHVLLPVLELPPVFIQVLGLLATQQDVFPFLDLDLELQVGFIEQL
ncbi:hypothetical protein PSGE105469_18225 [Pseudomonas gessardii]